MECIIYILGVLLVCPLLGGLSSFRVSFIRFHCKNSNFDLV